MESIITIDSLVLFSLALISVFLVSRQRRRARNAANTVRAQLEDTLTMLQLMQKHRALGAQSDQISTAQREQISRQIERNWPAWLRQFSEGADIEREWVQMRLRTDDFAAHCRAIDYFLVIISKLERRMSLLTSCMPSSAESIVDRCRAFEDLGRLRGLSMRAANRAHCSIELEVPLRYLCLRLMQVSSANAALHNALREIAERLLDAPRVSITPKRCFELLTPIIDASIDDVRQSITQTMPTKNRGNMASVATLKKDGGSLPREAQVALATY